MDSTANNFTMSSLKTRGLSIRCEQIRPPNWDAHIQPVRPRVEAVFTVHVLCQSGVPISVVCGAQKAIKTKLVGRGIFKPWMNVYEDLYLIFVACLSLFARLYIRLTLDLLPSNWIKKYMSSFVKIHKTYTLPRHIQVQFINIILCCLLWGNIIKVCCIKIMHGRKVK